MGVGRFALAARGVEFVGADVNDGVAVAVVGYIYHHHVPLPSVGTGQAQGEFVGLGAGADKEADAERVGEGGGEPLRIFNDVVMKVAGVGVENAGLVGECLGDVGVAVADVGDVVDHIEIGAAGVVVQILADATHNFERFGVGDREHFAQSLLALGNEFGVAGEWGGEAAWGDAAEQVGVGVEAEPDIALTGEGHAGVVNAHVEEVCDELEVEMGGPVAVDGVVAHPGDWLPLLNVHAHAEVVEGTEAEVAVEGVEGGAVVGFVFEDDDGAVVEGGGVVVEGVDNPIEGGMNGRSRPHKQI